MPSESRQAAHEPSAIPTKPARAPSRPNHASPANTAASSTAAVNSIVRGSSPGKSSRCAQVDQARPITASGAAPKDTHDRRREADTRTSESASAANSPTKGQGPTKLERVQATNATSDRPVQATSQAS